MIKKYDFVFSTKGDVSLTRNQKSYDKIDTGVKFFENELTTAPYSLDAHRWNDVRFKVKKGTGLSTASTVWDYVVLDFLLSRRVVRPKSALYTISVR